MNTLETIIKRKSTRSFKDEKIEFESIKKIVEAGNMAAGTPMAGKVYFNIVSNKNVLNLIVENTKKVMENSGNEMLMKISSNPNFNPFYGAPVAIVISADKTDDSASHDMAVANVACAGENILLAATDLGVSSCYMTSPTLGFNIPSTKEAVGISENMEPLAIVVIGYSDDDLNHSPYPENPDNITYIE